MARMGTIASRAESLLAAAVVATTPVAGGDICTSTRLRLSDGRSALIKTRPHAPDGFFPTEAAGLRRLGAAGGTDVPDVLAVEEDCLILRWVESGRPSAEAAERFGRSLALTHREGGSAGGSGSGAAFGSGSGSGSSSAPGKDGFIGTLPMPNRAAESWPEFYATRRILPYLKLARDRSAISPDDARSVEAVVRKIVDLAGPAEPPARLHGDLWSGNVLWGRVDRVWLVDPATYSGHRETDLAMLALFGLPHLQRMLDAYHEADPLSDGWEERAPLHQLFPLLVHACMFGGSYGSRAADAARSLF